MPINSTHLQRAVEKAALLRGVNPKRLRHTVASTVVLQMVPGGVVKGGTGVRQRVSEHQARLTNDLDFARPHDVGMDDFADAFADSLAEGWGGFTGRLREGRKASPDGVPGEYVMEPFRVVLQYRGTDYGSVLFELGHSEVGSADDAVERLGTDVVAIFEELGLPTPKPVPVMRVEHQIAQKIHACTSVGPGGTNSRAHDLVDIQILCGVEDIDYAEIGRIGQRLFAYRQLHAWPPTVGVHPGWESLYQAALVDLESEFVVADVHAAADVVNEIIRRAVGT